MHEPEGQYTAITHKVETVKAEDVKLAEPELLENAVSGAMAGGQTSLPDNGNARRLEPRYRR